MNTSAYSSCVLREMPATERLPWTLKSSTRNDSRCAMSPTQLWQQPRYRRRRGEATERGLANLGETPRGWTCATRGMRACTERKRANAPEDVHGASGRGSKHDKHAGLCEQLETVSQ